MPEEGQTPQSMKHLSLVLKISVSLGACALLYLIVDWAEFAETLKSANYYWLILVFVLMHVDRAFMGYKWAILLKGADVPTTFGKAIQAYYVGSFWSSFLPLSVGGDVVRIGWMARENKNAPQILSSVVVERLLGALALSLLSSVSFLLFFFYLGWELPAFAKIILVFLVASLGGLAVVFSSWSHRLLARLLPWVPVASVRSIIEKMTGALITYRRHPRVLFVFLMLSLLQCLIPIVAVYSTARAFQINVPLVWVMIAVPIVLAISSVPVSVKGIGIIEGTYAFLFSFAGIPVSQSVMMSVADRVLQLIVTLPGALLTVRMPREETFVPLAKRLPVIQRNPAKS
jgi:glycosyltransferase 2 family protein